MYLQKIEMQGFKTFANRTVLEFLPPKGDSRGITAIVGPNGSGKSNIADAVRWVLGEQSMKLIRGKKAADVIFSGSEKRARSGFAEVSLTLNNEDKKIPGFDYDEVLITRRLYRDGESEYLINKNKVRLADINMLLAQANFGQRTYSVIGQGMVDAVLVASPKERKEFFDEAAGVKQYQLKREASIRKLESSEENLGQAELILGELEPRMRYLSRQARRLEERAELESELIALEYDYFGTLHHRITEELKAIDARTKTVDEDRKRKESEIEGLRKELAEMETEETASDGLMELQKAYEAQLEKRNSLREKEIQLKNRIELELAKAKAAAQAPVKLPMPIEKVISAIDGFSKKHDKLVERIMKADDLGTAKKAAEELAGLGEEIGTLLQDLKAPTEKKEVGKIEVPKELQKELELVSKDVVAMASGLTKLQDEMQDWGKKESEKRADFFDTQKKMQSMQSDLFTLDRHLSDHRVDRARVETRLESLKNEAAEALEDKADAALAHKPKADMNVQEASSKLHKLRTQVASIGSIDQAVVDEHREAKERYDFLTAQVEDLRQTKIQLEEMIVDLDGLIKKRSDQAFSKINKEFDIYFKKLFGGGTASLKKIEQDTDEDEMELAEGEEPEEKPAKKRMAEAWLGLDIHANPPGKRVKNIHVLSGGERALTSIALICAILTTNPSPFVVLDEVDAALDESNASRFSEIVFDLSHTTQFLLITHNRYTMEKGQVLYGVTMADDSTSRILSIKLEDADDVIHRRKVAAGEKA